jgi:hypothetical protein
MKRESIIELANLIASMKITASKLEESIRKNDNERAMKCKREILNLKREVDKLL